MDHVLDFRKRKDEFFRTAKDSPIPADRRRDFPGLRYYQANPELAFTVVVEETDGSEVTIGTTDGQTRAYRRAGRVRFRVKGDEATLTLFDTGHAGWFLPFRDSTSGIDTYGAGRYLDLHPNDDGTVTVDFNYAYNPFCVYDDCYSCPLPPHENWLTVPIEAGELMFVDSG